MRLPGIQWATCTFALCLLAASCTGNKDSSNNSSGGGSGEGVCRGNCPKTCSGDDDCDTDKGQMCCNFGDGAKTCTEPQSCPRFCTSDGECNTEQGEACCAVSLASTELICSKPQACLHFCKKNADCGEAEVCCTTYSQPLCVKPTQCPNECGSTIDCKTEEGEVCCKTFEEDLAQILSVSGVCYSKGMSCQKSCASSNECDTAAGEMCCEGFCAKGCKKKCEENQDCDMGAGQLCCQNPVVETVWWEGGQELFSSQEGGDCCSYGNPCDWDHDGTCDCGGDYEWDWADCQGRYGDDVYNGYDW